MHHNKKYIYNTMKPFTKYETRSILIVFIVLFLVTGFNMSVSLRRGRDSIRKNDMSAIQKSLDTYVNKYGVYPMSNESGQIIGCFDSKPQFDQITGVVLNAIPCQWGESKFEDVNVMPRDPNYNKGASYRYVSDGESYTFYIALEGKDEAEYSTVTYNKYLQCGTKICNYERSI